MLILRSAMAEVSRKLGAGVHKLCSFKLNYVFSVNPRPRLSVFGGFVNNNNNNNEKADVTGNQPCRTYCTVLVRVSEKQPRCPVTVISSRSQSHSGNSSLHNSKTAYYDVLRVSPNATQAQIKTAYYRQSFRYHPDRNAGSHEAVRRFSEISEAYTVLGSITLRRKYDRGVLSLADVQSAGKPSRKDTARAQSSDQNQQQQQGRSRPFHSTGGKPMYDFDAFYRAHYGEQLEREKNLRRWRERREQAQHQDFSRWKLEKGTEVAVGALLVLGVVLIFSLNS